MDQVFEYTANSSNFIHYSLWQFYFVKILDQNCNVIKIYWYLFPYKILSSLGLDTVEVI